MSKKKKEEEEIQKDNDKIMRKRSEETGYGSRRSYHWEIQGGERVLVEE